MPRGRDALRADFKGLLEAVACATWCTWEAVEWVSGSDGHQAAVLATVAVRGSHRYY
jgi:hypothetical protein